jgi:hypothetical protein
MMKTFTRVLLVSTLSTGTAQAEMINFTLSGIVDYARFDQNGNYFNTYYAPSPDDIRVGDLVTATATFDDNLISPFGNSLIDIDITVQVGDTTFTNSDEIFNDPMFKFYNGYFTGLIFDATYDGFDTNFSGIPGDLALDFAGKSHNGTYLTYEGHWTGIQVSAVPVPAAVWLFGSGLLGLVGVARRKA